METSKTKKIVIVTGPKGNQVMKMHKCLNSQNIDHFVLFNKRKKIGFFLFFSSFLHSYYHKIVIFSRLVID